MAFIYTEVRTPTAYKTGDWDGKMSDLCLCRDKEGEYHLARVYEYSDGQIEWYDKEDFGLKHDVVKWIDVELI